MDKCTSATRSPTRASCHDYRRTLERDKSYLRVLSVYDVANVQFLARRLLLESLGYWRYLGTHESLLRLKLPARSSPARPRPIPNDEAGRPTAAHTHAPTNRK